MKRRRLNFAYVIISPHQDDEWVGCAQLLRDCRYTKIIVIITKSLWPSNKNYGVRQIESSRAAQLVNAEVQYLGLKEEELFSPPYDPLNYIGAGMESTWAPKLLAMLQSFQHYRDGLFVFFPSADDGAGHVVHQFTRNISLTALAGLTGTVHKYTYNVYAEPSDTRSIRCDFRFKFNNFPSLYPTQWTAARGDTWVLNQLTIHSTYEWIKKV